MNIFTKYIETNKQNRATTNNFKKHIARERMRKREQKNEGWEMIVNTVRDKHDHVVDKGSKKHR